MNGQVLRTLVAFLLLPPAPLMAQDTPAGTPETQVAPEETPAPATNSDALEKQYFINYNLKQRYYISWQPTITANWEANNGNRWLVPVGGGLGRITKLGFQPVNLTAQFYGNAVHPPGASPWGMRLQIALLFPKLTKAQEKMMLEQRLKKMDQDPPQK